MSAAKIQQIGYHDLKIFGTADHLGIRILTTDETFVKR